MKYVVISGGVISGIGKGITACSIGKLLQHSGFSVTSIIIDPYLNIDAGMMSPYEHGEVYVLNDGTETDLDLGNYERFLGIQLTKDHNITSGKIFWEIIKNEREGKYLGKTVQTVPHVTDYIKEMINFFSTTSSVLVTHYQGLTVKQIDQLRAEMRKHGILFKITKNRITKLALEGSKYKKLENLFSGPTAVAFSEDAITSAKILTKFAKKNSNLKIIGGIMEEEPLSVEDVEKIATLPTLDEARAKIVGILSSPAQKIISILLAPGSKIAILAHAKSKKT